MKPLSTAKLSLGQVARKYGLARASILNYEALGLLLPAGRSTAGYRFYGAVEIARLKTIRQYREAGLSLAMIGKLLDGQTTAPALLLEKRLTSLCQEVEHLKAQQKILARLLAAREFRSKASCSGVEAWVALLERTGFSEEDRRDWHREFEADSPEQHADFLRSLGLSAAEIRAIRQASQAVSGGSKGADQNGSETFDLLR